MKGLIAEIFENKAHGNCSNHGLSSKVSQVVITSEDFDIDELFEATEDMPEVVIIKRERNPFKDIIAVPREVLESGKHYMFGGSFIYTSDSRFGEISSSPIKLFDRVEG